MVALVFVPLLDSKKFKGPKAASKNVGDSWLGLSVASAGLTQVAYAMIYHPRIRESAYAAYATMIIFSYCAYALFFQFPFLHIPFISKKNAAQIDLNKISL